MPIRLNTPLSLCCAKCAIPSLRMRKPQVLKKSAQICFTLSNETLTFADRLQVAEEKQATCRRSSETFCYLKRKQETRHTYHTLVLHSSTMGLLDIRTLFGYSL